MAYILNIETSTDICSVAISNDKELVALQEIKEPYQHASKITLITQECLKRSNIKMAQLDAVAVSSGPGSYTALRVGTSIAKGICYALNKPLIAVDTLHSIALASKQSDDSSILYCSMIDARRMEVYGGIWDHEMNLLLPIQAMTLDEKSFETFRAEGKEIVFSGNGAQKYIDAFAPERSKLSPILSSAKHLIPIAANKYLEKEFVSLIQYKPFYLKPPNINRPKKIL
ncbi:MAG: tRNA (adenosine(37)-N6)-threonylcarbamoyltransferase complex dimerization subunit type 1 TsaB [Bacteroidota bacterium]